jgi:hypothetical protein
MKKDTNIASRARYRTGKEFTRKTKDGERKGRGSSDGSGTAYTSAEEDMSRMDKPPPSTNKYLQTNI